MCCLHCHAIPYKVQQTENKKRIGRLTFRIGYSPLGNVTPCLAVGWWWLAWLINHFIKHECHVQTFVFNCEPCSSANRVIRDWLTAYHFLCKHLNKSVSRNCLEII